MEAILTELAKQGPIGLVAMIMWWNWREEKADRKALMKSLLDLSTEFSKSTGVLDKAVEFAHRAANRSGD